MLQLLEFSVHLHFYTFFYFLHFCFLAFLNFCTFAFWHFWICALLYFCIFGKLAAESELGLEGWYMSCKSIKKTICSSYVVQAQIILVTSKQAADDSMLQWKPCQFFCIGTAHSAHVRCFVQVQRPHGGHNMPAIRHWGHNMPGIHHRGA